MTEGRTGFAGGIVSLAFDDGWRSIYENALPILDGDNLKSTHYIVSRYLDHPLYMNARQVCDLERHGHEVGCHSVSHKHLPQQTLAIIEEEIAQSQRCLQDIGLPTQTFAYPYGEYDERVIDAVKRFGFKGARTGGENDDSGFNDKLADPYLLKGQAVRIDTPPARIEEWLHHAGNNDLWLILVFHQIDHEGKKWSTTPETLRRIVEHLLTVRARVVTVREGLEILARG